jgi:hypothetical protein
MTELNEDSSMQQFHQTESSDCVSELTTFNNMKEGLLFYKDSPMTVRDDMAWKTKTGFLEKICNNYVFNDCDCNSNQSGFRKYINAIYFGNLGRLKKEYNYLDRSEKPYVFNAMLVSSVFKSPFCVGKHLPGEYTFYKNKIRDYVKDETELDIHTNALITSLEPYLDEVDLVEEEKENKIKQELLCVKRSKVKMAKLKTNDRTFESRSQTIELVLAEYAESVQIQKHKDIYSDKNFVLFKVAERIRYLRNACSSQEYSKARNNYTTLLNTYDNIVVLMEGMPIEKIIKKQNEVNERLSIIGDNIRKWNNIFNGFSKESDVKNEMYDDLIIV